MKILNLIAILLVYLFVRADCDINLDDLSGEKIFASHTWHTLVKCYNEALKIADDMDRIVEVNRMETILKVAGEFRLELIGKVLSILFCGNDSRLVKGQNRGNVYVMCDAGDKINQGETLVIRSFGSITPTSDYDFSVDIGRRPNNGPESLAQIRKVMEIISKTEETISFVLKDKGMNFVLDSNAYPEIMEFAQNYLSDDAPGNIKTPAISLHYEEYKSAVTFTVCEVANAILIANFKHLNLMHSTPIAKFIETCSIFVPLDAKKDDDARKTWRKETLFPLSKANEVFTRIGLFEFSVPDQMDLKNASFRACMNKATSPDNTKWTTYAMLGGCHHFAEEAYGTIGALAMVKGYPANHIYNCRDFAEAYFENFSMLIAHWHEIYVQGDQQKVKAPFNKDDKDWIIDHSFSSKLKYFKRVMKALEGRECYFLDDLKQPKRGQVRWNILEDEFKRLSTLKAQNQLNKGQIVVLSVIEFYLNLSEVRPADIEAKYKNQQNVDPLLKEKEKKEDDLRVKKEIFDLFDKFVNAQLNFDHFEPNATSVMFDALIHPFVETFLYFAEIPLKIMARDAADFEVDFQKDLLI